MSSASTQHLHHGCSGSFSSGAMSESSASGQSRRKSPGAESVHHRQTPSPRHSPQPHAPPSPSSQQEHQHNTDSRASPPRTTHHSVSAGSSQQARAAGSTSYPATALTTGSSNHAATCNAMEPPRLVRLPTAAQRRRARELATVLLTMTTCPGCSRPVQDPVTLPCGHSSCLQCIKDRVLPSTIPSEEEVQPLPCLTHLPPRLPLGPMTVPCPAHGCPRSAIGRGIGAWAGHKPRYGLIPTYTERLPLGPQDVGPGAPPVDGFVMGVADHPLRLTVIGPQTRSKAHLFAVPPEGVEPTTSAAGGQQATATLLPSLATSNMLRTDVTLSKATAILKRYASSPLPRRERRNMPGSGGGSPGSTSRSRSSRCVSARKATDHAAPFGSTASARSRNRVRSRRQRPSISGPSSSRRSHRSGPPRAGMGIFGRDESELESGTVGGVRAALDSDDDRSNPATRGFTQDSDDASADTALEDTYLHGGRSTRAHFDGDEDEESWTVHAGSDDDVTEAEDDRLWPDEVGGAFSRPLASSIAARRRSKAKLKRRRGRLSDDSVSSAACFRRANAPRTENKIAKKNGFDSTEEDALRHVDSGWSTEDSAASAYLKGEDGGSEALVDAVRRRRAQSHSRVSASSDADTDIDANGRYARNRAVEAKHSLALSSKLSTNGEPLIQTVATLHAELVEVLECQLCYLLLYNPLTTPCGHTFCKSCFARSLDHGDRCPLCRAAMPNFSFFQDHRPNAALLKVLTSDTATFSDEDALDSDLEQEAKDAATSTYAGISIAMGSEDKERGAGPRVGRVIDDDPETAPHHYGFKRLYEQRKAAIEQEEREARLSTPIFVCTLAFPGMPTILHIFEPRYRLMVRRCLESGNPRFGMVLPSRSNGGTEEYGTMLEIKSVQMLADGRSMLETVGSYRFRLLEKGSLDGYTVGRVERVDDISMEEEAELERAVLVRRAELERKKAAEAAVERPRAPAMAPSTSAPERVQANGEGSGGDPSARPQLPRHESDALSIYRSVHSTENGQQHAHPRDAGTPQQAQEEGSGDEDGLMPFKPVPAEPSIHELVEICTSFIETLRSGSAPWLLSRLNHTYGPMPSADEVERLGYWMALVMPIDEHEKAKLLPIRSRRLRLCLVVHWIEQLRQSWWFNSGCTVS